MRSASVILLIAVLLSGCAVPAEDATADAAPAAASITPTPTPTPTSDPLPPEELFLLLIRAYRNPDAPAEAEAQARADLEGSTDEQLLEDGVEMCDYMDGKLDESRGPDVEFGDIETRWSEYIDLRRELLGDFGGIDRIQRINYLAAVGSAAAWTMCQQHSHIANDWVSDVSAGIPEFNSGASEGNGPSGVAAGAAEVEYIRALRAGPLGDELDIIGDVQLLQAGWEVCQQLDAVQPSSALEWSQYLTRRYVDDTDLAVASVISGAAMVTLCPQWSSLVD